MLLLELQNDVFLLGFAKEVLQTCFACNHLLQLDLKLLLLLLRCLLLLLILFALLECLHEGLQFLRLLAHLLVQLLELILLEQLLVLSVEVSNLLRVPQVGYNELLGLLSVLLHNALLVFRKEC